MRRVVLYIFILFAPLLGGCDKSFNFIGAVDSSLTIIYATTDGEPINISRIDGISVESNRYKGGVGIMKFSKPISKIDDYCFYNATTLQNITLPKSIKKIGRLAFKNCTSLKGIILPESITKIGESAFVNCSVLKTITIPEGVTEIGMLAFDYCSALTTIYCKPSTPPTIYNWSFGEEVSGRKIYVPRASVEAYKNSWISYADAIVGYDF